MDTVRAATMRGWSIRPLFRANCAVSSTSWVSLRRTASTSVSKKPASSSNSSTSSKENNPTVRNTDVDVARHDAEHMRAVVEENDPETMDSETLAARLQYLEQEAAIQHATGGNRLSPAETVPKPNPDETTCTPFNRYLKMLHRSRAACATDSHTYDYVRRTVASRLADRMLDVKRTFPQVMDLSGGLGTLAQYIPPGKVERLTMVDMSRDSLFRDVHNRDPKGTVFHRNTIEEDGEENNGNEHNTASEPDFIVERIHGNEQVPHLVAEREGLYDAVVSSLNMHWINDVPSFLQSVKRTLKPDGMFLAAMFTGDTLFELRTSMQLAELERFNALRPHVSPMAQPRDVAAQMQIAGFNLITVDVDEIQIYYPNAIELMKDLRYMGEGSAVGIAGSNVLTRDTLLASCAVYEQLYGLRAPSGDSAGAADAASGEDSDGGKPLSRVADTDDSDGDVIIPATFQVTYLIGWRPHESQPKPLAPGSAKHSFADMGRADVLARREAERQAARRDSDPKGGSNPPNGDSA